MITIIIIVLIILIVFFVHKAKVDKYEQTSYYQSTRTPYSHAVNNKGNYGEYLLSNCLQKYEKDGAKFLYNCYIPKDNGETTEIDLIMLHSSGIYVFESKNYSGWIFGSEYQNNWTQTLSGGRNTSKEHFFNPIMQNKVRIKWIENLIGEKEKIYSIVVFSERCTLKEINIISSDIFVLKRNEVEKCIDDISDSKGRTMSQEKIQYLYEQLLPYTLVDENTKMSHVNKIREREINKKIVDYSIDNQIRLGQGDNLRCPQCGGKLVIRTAQRGTYAGSQFYGCSNYPKCKFIKNI